MILGIDIGNSTIAFGLIKEGRVERVLKLENEPESELFRLKLINFFEHLASREKVRKVVICSVVPASTAILQRKVKRIFRQKALIVGRDVRIPIVNRYKSPRQVGKDRLLCAFAAREEYGAPLIVIDLGTAITFDGISAKGEYLGGAIIPGLRLSAEALFEKTALLPRIKIEEPKGVIGRTTEESIQSGIFHGYGALCDGMIARLSREMCFNKVGRQTSDVRREGVSSPAASVVCRQTSHDLKVIMTGGYAEILRKYLTHPVEAVDQELIFKGMARLVESRESVTTLRVKKP